MRLPRRPGGGSEAWSGTGLLSLATLGSGVLAYAFHILAARTLGADDYGRIAVLWGVMFLVAIVLFRPVEQTASRSIADGLARGEGVGQILRSVVWIAAGAMVAVALLSVSLWSVLTDRLFDGDAGLTLLMLLGVVGYGASYLVRGLLGGVRWFGGYALGLMADAVVRLAVALPLVVVASTDLAAAAIAAAGAAGALVPLWAGRERLREILRPRERTAHFRTSDAASFAAPAVVMAAADQILVNASAVLVVLGGADAAVAAVVFAATMLVRIPVYVFQGVAAAILPNLTRMAAAAQPRAMASAIRKASMACLAFGVVVAALAFVAGPFAMRLVYGADFDADAFPLAVLGVGVGLYLLASTDSQALLALDRGRWAAWGWGVAAVLFVGLYFALPASPLMAAAAAFTVATGAGAAIVAAALEIELRRAATAPSPVGGGEVPALEHMEPSVPVRTS